MITTLQIAEAKGPRSEHRWSIDVFQWNDYFDPEYVKWAMKNLKSFKDLDNGFDGAYQRWEKESKNRPLHDSMEALERHPDKVGIKRAHDLQHVWEWWAKNQAGVVRPAHSTQKAERYNGWNNWTEQQCNWLIKKPHNPFYESCIIPDWRSPRMIEADNKALIAIGKDPE